MDHIGILQQLNPKPYAPACTFRTGAFQRQVDWEELALHVATEELFQQEH